jgi:hypothetical protein
MFLHHTTSSWKTSFCLYMLHREVLYLSSKFSSLNILMPCMSCGLTWISTITCTFCLDMYLDILSILCGRHRRSMRNKSERQNAKRRRVYDDIFLLSTTRIEMRCTIEDEPSRTVHGPLFVDIFIYIAVQGLIWSKLIETLMLVCVCVTKLQSCEGWRDTKQIMYIPLLLQRGIIYINIVHRFVQDNRLFPWHLCEMFIHFPIISINIYIYIYIYISETSNVHLR